MEVRAYTGPADLRRMQELVQRTWTPTSEWHIGDLAWGRFMHLDREAEWPTKLWIDGATVVAWAWVRLPGELNFCLDPVHIELFPAILAWFDAVASGPERAVTVVASNAVLNAALIANGYEQQGGDPFFWCNLLALENLQSEPTLPIGFSLRTVEASDLSARAAVHRAAFHPSRVTTESYRQVTEAWPYQPNLDWVAVNTAGDFVSSCLIWFDAVNRVGELEPVGTDPAYQRRGLSRAVCLRAMHALRDSGATHATVLCGGGDGNPGPDRLYASLGFNHTNRIVTYRRTVPTDSRG